MKNILECCVDSVESALAAEAGGADRIELCSGLVIGGITPTKALFQKVKEATNLPIRVLLRPRFGDFCYTQYEHEILKQEVKIFRRLGADGIVIGSLAPDGSLNIQQMKELMEEAADMKVTLHRAFDMCKDPLQTMEEAKKLGVTTILTSGQKNCAIDGMELLAQLVKKSKGGIEILVGGGVDSAVIERIYCETKATSYHMSGKISVPSQMEYRNSKVSMGLSSMSEYEIWRTSENRIREAKVCLERL